ncbi:hypothetical protein ACFONG_11235 [Uliginosibacterium paludis]|uniref:DUF3592 domain-containing protein n=1 Tax=Uliginosibacterium paludis TaxID=1615952 RepID=A0ABV2CM25_9RHOO
MRVMLKVVLILLGMADLALAAQAIASGLRWANQAHYREAHFIVTGSVAGTRRSSPWLKGEIEGAAERFQDSSVSAEEWPDVVARMPVGAAIPVRYNPGMTSMRFGSESLRVISRDWRFERDRAFLAFYFGGLFLPTLIGALALRLTRPGKPAQP